MSAGNELRRARKSLARGRRDEALLFLWNALEPARLEGGPALRELEVIATRVRAEGDENERHEAERLLASARGGAAERAQAEAVEWSRAERLEHAEAPPEPEIGVAAGDALGDLDGTGRPAPRRAGLARFLLPAVFILIVLVNVLARAFGD